MAQLTARYTRYKHSPFLLRLNGPTPSNVKTFTEDVKTQLSKSCNDLNKSTTWVVLRATECVVQHETARHQLPIPTFLRKLICLAFTGSEEGRLVREEYGTFQIV